MAVAAAIEAFAPAGREEQARQLAANVANIEEQKAMAEMNELCGVWKKKSKAGTTYYGGKTSREIVIPAGAFVSVFKNEAAAEDDKKPALRIMWSEG